MIEVGGKTLLELPDIDLKEYPQMTTDTTKVISSSPNYGVVLNYFAGNTGVEFSIPNSQGLKTLATKSNMKITKTHKFIVSLPEGVVENRRLYILKPKQSPETMNLSHQQLLAEIEKRARKPNRSSSSSYEGTVSRQYYLTNPDKWAIAKAWVKENKSISLKDFLSLLNSLNAAGSYEEKTLAGMILSLFPKLRSSITSAGLGKWLDNVHGWSEVDSLCQNNFQYQGFFRNWPQWEKAIRSFSKNPNTHKRRASLVLLTGPVNYSPNRRLSDLAFENIDRLKSERDILITKAVSWLLRSLTKYHPEEVRTYLTTNATSLPKIAFREAGNKLKFGVKKS